MDITFPEKLGQRAIRRCEKAMQVYLCLMVFMIPMERISFNIFSITVRLGGNTYKYVPYGLLIWGALLVLKRGQKPYFSKTPLDLPILVYFCLCILALITSYDVRASLEEAVHLLAYFLWFYLIINHVKEKRQVRWLLIALLAGSIYISLYGMHNFFVLGRRATGLGKCLRLGVYFAMTIPVILGQCLWGRSLRWRLSFGLGALLMFATVPFTFARGPWIGLFGAMVFLGFLRDKRIFVVLAAILVLFSLLLPDSVISRAKSLAEVHLSQEVRISDWRVALNMIKDHPITGVGLGDAYLSAYPLYKPCDSPHIFRRCHNLYLYLAASIGIPGLAAYIWLLLTFFQNGLRTLRAGGKEVRRDRASHLLRTEGVSEQRGRGFFRGGGANPGDALIASILAGVVGILIASLFDHHFHATEVAMTFWFLMGLGIVLIREVDREKAADFPCSIGKYTVKHREAVPLGNTASASKTFLYY
ncbi:O-antigen ligase family protein [candidate division NPL-UPA2 bacterium]|nr:O-antigen ligase family protein [candidate division NPL-UPA2 bacterium]